MGIGIKVLVIGNSGVGKTSLCLRYINDNYRQAYKPTIGVEFCSKEVISAKKNKFNLYFWDIGGQERYIHMTHVFYKDADFCLIVFDITNRESFEACARWKNDLDNKYLMDNGQKCPCLLIGNKCDLRTRVLEQSEIDDFCTRHNFYGYMEISAKNDVMVKDTIEYVTEQIVRVKELELEKTINSTIKEDLTKMKNKLVHLKEDSSNVHCTRSCCLGF